MTNIQSFMLSQSLHVDGLLLKTSSIRQPFTNDIFFIGLQGGYIMEAASHHFAMMK